MDTIGRSSDASRENLTNPEVPASSSSGPSVESCRCLSQGIDSLDLSLYVEWDANWACLSEALQQGKADAAGTDGIEFGDGSCLILPSGKPPNFRWHLQWPEFHLYLAKSRTPQHSTPNAFASMNSETLWRHGVSGAVRLVVETVEVLGGSVQRNRVSRCDPATDWLIPGGLSLEFLRELRVPRHTKTSQMMSGDRLETFHFGNKDSPIQLRIYDKANEVASKGDKLWFLNAWGLTATASKRRSWLDCRKKRIDILDRRKSCDGRSASWRPR